MCKEHFYLLALTPGAAVIRCLCDGSGYVPCRFVDASWHGASSRIGTTLFFVGTSLTVPLLGTIADRLVFADAASWWAEGTPVALELFTFRTSVVICCLVKDKVRTTEGAVCAASMHCEHR